MIDDRINKDDDRCVVLPLTLGEAKRIRRMLLEATCVQANEAEWEENHELAKFIEDKAGGWRKMYAEEMAEELRSGGRKT